MNNRTASIIIQILTKHTEPSKKLVDKRSHEAILRSVSVLESFECFRKYPCAY